MLWLQVLKLTHLILPGPAAVEEISHTFSSMCSFPYIFLVKSFIFSYVNTIHSFVVFCLQQVHNKWSEHAFPLHSNSSTSYNPFYKPPSSMSSLTVILCLPLISFYLPFCIFPIRQLHCTIFPNYPFKDKLIFYYILNLILYFNIILLKYILITYHLIFSSTI